MPLSEVLSYSKAITDTVIEIKDMQSAMGYRAIDIIAIASSTSTRDGWISRLIILKHMAQ